MTKKLKEKRPKIQVGPLWDWTKGVTQSALTQFLSCREQFALGYIDGWTPRGFHAALEFGSMIHFMLQRLPGDTERIAFEVCKSYHDARKPQLTSSQEYENMQLHLVSAETIFPLYVDYWAEADSKIKFLHREQVFSIPHKFISPLEPPGCTSEVLIKGMRDGDYRNAVGGLGLFETKTKSQIDDVLIADGLRADFQAMFYLYGQKRDYKENPAEILYNIIRRPQLRLKKGEALVDYAKRVRDDIKERPSWYFRRFEVTVVPEDIEVFIKTTLDPVLCCLLEWWESIKDDPFNRWSSPYHYRNLAALTNKYGKAPLYDLMIRGKQNLYFQRSSVFPELEESLPKGN